MAKQPNVVREANTGLPNEDRYRPAEDARNYYSERNPFGPYFEYRHRPDGAKGQEYIEGFSTQQNVDQWSERAARNSYGSHPSVAPGSGRRGK